MQEANFTVNTTLTEREELVQQENRVKDKKKNFGRKGLAFALALMSLSMTSAFSGFASPQEEELLVFSEEGAIISQEDQSVSLFSEDVLAGDTVSRSQQIVDYASQFIGRPYLSLRWSKSSSRIGLFRFLNGNLRTLRDRTSPFLRGDWTLGSQCRIFGQCYPGRCFSLFRSCRHLSWKRKNAFRIEFPLRCNH